VFWRTSTICHKVVLRQLPTAMKITNYGNNLTRKSAFPKHWISQGPTHLAHQITTFYWPQQEWNSVCYSLYDANCPFLAKTAPCPFPQEALISRPFWNLGRSTNKCTLLRIFLETLDSVQQGGHWLSSQWMLIFPRLGTWPVSPFDTRNIHSYLKYHQVKE
jgi:hypothetical protein